MSVHVDFEPVGRRGACSEDQSLLECARQLSVDLVSICGGMGSCDRCRVQVVSGQVSEPTPDEKNVLTERDLKQGYRLACQTFPQSDVRLHVPPESLTAPQRTQVEGLEVGVTPDPPVRALQVELIPPRLGAAQADDQNLWTALARQHQIQPGRIDLPVARDLALQLRESNWHVQVALRGDEIVAVGSPAARWLGLAVDIGTTKIAGYLVDMQSGQTLASLGLMNPQISYGEDIIARIGAAARSSDEAEHLHQLLAEALSQMAATLCSQLNAKPTDIVEAVVVANTAIHHLFLRLPVHQLGLAPYVPAVRSALNVKAREVGLEIAPGAFVHLLPNVAGFVGADHVAVVLGTRLAEADGTALALDIGTNTEICLSHRGQLTSVSVASGPAFEGAHITFGMRAAAGAIEHVRLIETRFEYQTIGNVAPVGICGSGLLDVMAELRRAGVLNRRWRMGEHPRVRLNNGRREFVLVDETGRSDSNAITISQHDVVQLLLAKAAIRMGIQALVEANGLSENDIDQVIIAGAFGTFIDVASAIEIGMLPELPLDRFKQVGNAAGTGARMALISRVQRAEAERLAQRIRYIELASVPGFSRKFAHAMCL